MCLDPHAVAKIEVRAAIELLQAQFESIEASNAEVSKAGMVELARLKRLLDECCNCYSRRRSVFLLNCIIRLLAELAFRMIGTSICILIAILESRRWINDDWCCTPTSSARLEDLAKGLGQTSGYLSVLSVFDRSRSARSQRSAYPAIRGGAGRACRTLVRNRSSRQRREPGNIRGSRCA